MVVMIVANGLLMVFSEGWSLPEGVYFWFVTLTTTGFGDYVPGRPQRIRELSVNISRNNEDEAEEIDAGEITASIFFGVFFTFYLILGLCVVSSAINSVMAAIEKRKCRPSCPGCIPRKTKEHIDTEENNAPEQRDSNMTYLSMENFGFQKENITPLS